MALGEIRKKVRGHRVRVVVNQNDMIGWQRFRDDGLHASAHILKFVVHANNDVDVFVATLRC